MKRRAFFPEEVLFSPTARCNLSCAHCDVRKSDVKLPINDAKRFLSQCANLGVERVGFSGGEPFLAPEFMCELSAAAVNKGLVFDRIMTNGVWWKDENDLKITLIRLFNAGYDGEICVSVDAFHAQDPAKIARFIMIARQVWRREDVVTIARVSGAKNGLTERMLKRLLNLLRDAGSNSKIKIYDIELSPTGKARSLKNPWDGRWFKEDYCKGPGNVFFVEPNGDVKPCCGYATESKLLTIGNIRRDSPSRIMKRLKDNKFVTAVFSDGLVSIREKLLSSGVKFPGKTTNHCYFCYYILNKGDGSIYG